MTMLLESIRGSARDSLRSIRSTPTVTATVVVTLALGIGANATMFGVIDRLLLRAPAHVVDPDRVVRPHVRRTFLNEPVTTAWMTYPDVRDFEAADTLEAVASIFALEMTVGEGAEAIRAHVQQASPGLFPLLGVRPLHGRFYVEAEDAVGAAAVAVVSHDFWRSRFGADVDVIGTAIRIGGIDHAIIGVAPAGFTGPDLGRVDIWLPLRTPAGGSTGWEESRGWYWLRPVARLAQGVSAEQAAAELTALHRAGRADDTRYDQDAAVVAEPLIAARGSQRSDDSVVARWLTGVSAVVLIIACANVVNILLARGMRRRREIGVKLALGVSTGRLIAQLLLEGVVLALLGGVAALLVAYWGAAAIRDILLPQVYWADSALNPRVLLFTFATALLAGVAAGAIPAFHAARHDLVALLAGGVRGGTTRSSRLRVAILVTQTTLSVMLLVGAGLFIESMARVRGIDLGFDPDRLLVVVPEIDESLMDAAERRAFFFESVERLRALPGVRSAAASMSAPFYTSFTRRLSVPDVPEPPTFEGGGPYYVAVTPDYFRALDVRVIEGRGLTDADTEGSGLVTVIEESMARAYWPGERAIGKCIKVGGDDAPCSIVVGVAETSARQSLLQEQNAQYYLSLHQHDMEASNLFVRLASSRPEPELIETIREELGSRSVAVRFVAAHPLRDWIDPQMRSWRLGSSMFSVFGLLALVIAAVGLYGVLAFGVAQRRHEIGVRSALGARPGRLVGMVVTQALIWVMGSLVLGVLGAMLAGRWIEPLLYGVTPTDASVLGGTTAILLLVAIAAAMIPGLRASRISPIIALKED